MPARISMTKKQRDALLALPETENEVVRHYPLDAKDLTAIASSRTPETRLGHALQLCCLRYPGRHLRRGEFLPPVMLASLGVARHGTSNWLRSSSIMVIATSRARLVRC